MRSLGKGNDIEERIIAAANACFLKYGLEKATMSRIAAEAGITRTSLNYYFRNKKKLLRTFIGNIEDQGVPRVAYLLSDKRMPLIRKIENFVDDYADLIGEFPMFPPFLIAECNSNPGWVIDLIKERKFSDLVDELKRQIAAAVAAGEIKPITLEALIVMVAGLCALPVLNKSLLMEFCFDHDEEKMLQFIASHKNETKRIIRLWLEPDSVQSNKCKPMPGRKKNRA